MLNFLTSVSLSSWDEAWYGEISKNILKSGDIFNLSFNNHPFFDHPPFVMWLQAICMKFFGISALSVRLPSFVLGIGAVIIVFLLGKELFSKSAGFFAGITLLIAPWFLTRSLSGNLDVPLTFLFVASFYFAVKSAINKKFLFPLSISLSFLFLTKSLVPFTILPALFFILWRKVNIKDLVKPFFLFVLITLPWFVTNFIGHNDFINRYFSIGYPGAKTDTNLLQNILLTKTYLHNGIGNIFLFAILSIPIGFILFNKKYLPLILFIGVFLLPFAFSDKGHIWHLIPLYPFLILCFYGLIDSLLSKHKFVSLLILFLLISSNQIKQDWYQIINIPAYKSDMEILSLKSREYDYPLVLDDDAVPEVLFYSDKGSIERTGDRGDLRTRFNSKDKFLLITRDWRLTEEKINQKEYTLIAKDRDKLLILK